MRKALKSMLALGLLTAAIASPGATVQAAEIGQTCNVRADVAEWIVARNSDGTGFREWIFANDGWYVSGFVPGGVYYHGHRNGQTEGYIRRDIINQGSCHW